MVGATVCEGEPTSPVIRVVPPELLVSAVPASTAKLAALRKFTPAAGAGGGGAVAVTVRTALPDLPPAVAVMVLAPGDTPVATAMNCWVPPTATVAVAGDTAMLDSRATVVVAWAVAVLPPKLAFKAAVPAATPVIMPPLLMATAAGVADT